MQFARVMIGAQNQGKKMNPQRLASQDGNLNDKSTIGFKQKRDRSHSQDGNQPEENRSSYTPDARRFLTKIAPDKSSTGLKHSDSFNARQAYIDSCEGGYIEIIPRKADLNRLVKYIDKMDPFVRMHAKWSDTFRQTKVDRDGHKHPNWSIEQHNSQHFFPFSGYDATNTGKEYGHSNERKTSNTLNIEVWDEGFGLLANKIIGKGEIDIEAFVREAGGIVERQKRNVELYHEKNLIGHCQIDIRFLVKDQYKSIKRSGSRGSLLAVISEGLREKKKSSSIHSSFVVMPEGNFRRNWDFLTCILLFYTALFTPVQMAFLADDMILTDIRSWIGIFCLDRLVDAVFIVDIFINFRSAYVTSTGMTVFDSTDVAWNYINSWFVVDLVSIMPFELLEFSADNLSAATLRSVKLVRLLRLLKLAKVVRASRIMRRFEANMNIKFGWIRLFKFILGLCVVGHWNACIWYMVGSISDPGEPSWISTHGLDWKGQVSAGDKYVASLYWAMMTLTTIGYGDIAAENTSERLYNTFAMMVCSLIFAYVVGTMCSLVQGLDVTNLRFQSMMDDINEYLDKNKVPKALQMRIRKYCLYQRDTTDRHNESEILEYFSPALRNEVALHNYLPILEKIIYFQTAPNNFLTELSLGMHQTVFGPNEVVLDDTSRDFSMYILMKGRVQVEKKDKIGMFYIAKEMNSGDVFGEQSLLFGGSISESYRTTMFCDFCQLKKRKFDEVICRYPVVRARITIIYVKQKWFELMSNREFGKELKKLRVRLDGGFKLADPYYNPSLDFQGGLQAQPRNDQHVHGSDAIKPDSLSQQLLTMQSCIQSTEQKFHVLSESVKLLQNDVRSILELLRQQSPKSTNSL